jgi:hypothetical protein
MNITLHNRLTNRRNNLMTARDNGLFTNPQNFDIPEDTVIRKVQRGRIPVYTRRVASNHLERGDFTNNDIIYGADTRYYPFLNKLLANNRRNDNREADQRDIIQGTLIRRMNLSKAPYNPTLIGDLPADDDTAPDVPEDPQYMSTVIFGTIKQFATLRQPIRVVVKRGGQAFRDITYQLAPDININKWWKGDRNYGVGAYYDWNTSDGYFLRSGDIIYFYTTDNTIEPRRLFQLFRQGETHCFLEPIRQYFLEQAQQPGYAKNTTSRYMNFANKVNEYIKIYDNGIPEDKIQEVCDKLQISVEIQDVLRNTSLKKLGKKSQKRFNYLNVREHHVNYYADNNKKIVEVETIDEMVRILNKKKEQNIKGIMFEGPASKPFAIHLPTKTYKLKTTGNQTIKEFNEAIGINKFGIERYREENLYNFVGDGCVFTSHIKFNEPRAGENVQEMDMSKAYTQFKRNGDDYIGFPSVISNYRGVNIKGDEIPEFLKTHLGMYYVYDMNIDGLEPNTKRYFEQFGIVNGEAYVLPSCELVYWWKLGVRFDVSFGAWGKRFDFDYTPEMCEKENGIPHYSKHVGKMVEDAPNKITKLFCGRKFASHLKSQYGSECVKYWPNDKYVEITQPREYYYSLPHIAGFIIAYCRMNILRQLIRFNYDNVIGVKLDSIVFHGDNMIDEAYQDMFKEKEAKYANFIWGDKYFYSVRDKHADVSGMFTSSMNMNGLIKAIEKLPYNPGPPCDIHGDALLAGQGGTGKTHYILNNKGYRNVLYATFAWKLITDMVNKYNVKGTTINHLVGANCEAYYESHNPPGVILLDEITMLSKSWVDKVIELYPHSQIIVAGDVDEKGYYQCTMSNIELWKIHSNFQVLLFEEDMRAKDEKLKKTKLELRKIVKENWDDVNFNIHKKLLKYVRDNFVVIKKENIKDTYNVKDIILVSTTKQIEYYNELLKDKPKKWLKITHTKDELLRKLRGEKDVKLHGEIADKEPASLTGYELRHAFTIHSVQGMTCKDKIYIDINNIMDINQIYTAVSRAEYLHQIVFVE